MKTYAYCDELVLSASDALIVLVKLGARGVVGWEGFAALEGVDDTDGAVVFGTDAVALLPVDAVALLLADAVLGMDWLALVYLFASSGCLSGVLVAAPVLPSLLQLFLSPSGPCCESVFLALSELVVDAVCCGACLACCAAAASVRAR